MSYDNLSNVSQNVLKFYQQLIGEERRISFIFDDFHFCCSRVIGLDMMENKGGRGVYILVSCAHTNTSLTFHLLTMSVPD
jgi:hypothetical protein